MFHSNACPHVMCFVTAVIPPFCPSLPSPSLLTLSLSLNPLALPHLSSPLLSMSLNVELKHHSKEVGQHRSWE